MTDSASDRSPRTGRFSVRMCARCVLLIVAAVVVSAQAATAVDAGSLSIDGSISGISGPASGLSANPRLLLAQIPGTGNTDPAPDETSLPIGEGGTAGSAAGESVVASLLRLLLALGLIGAVCYAAIRILKTRSQKSTLESGLLRLAGSLTIAPGKSVHVVCLGDKAWLIGSSETSTTLIDRVDDPVILERILAQSPVTPKPARDLQVPKQESERPGPSRREDSLRPSRPVRSGPDMRIHPDTEDGESEDASRNARDVLRSQRERLERLRGKDS